MKARELMLGDWVKMYNGKGEYIDDTRIDIHTLYTFSQDGQNVLRLEPIPLTLEILEKNTSESNKNVFGGMNYALTEDFFIENRGDRFCLSRRMAGHKYSTFWVCDIHYVHELQHCLRLINCDKEIVL